MILVIFLILMVNISALVFPWCIKLFIDNVLTSKDVTLINRIIFVLFLSVALKAVFNYYRKVCSLAVGEKIICDLREKVFGHLLFVYPQDTIGISPSDILSRLTSDIESIRRYFIDDVAESIYGMISVVLILIILSMINLRLMVFAISAMPFFCIFYIRMISRYKKGFDNYRILNGNLIKRINEVLNANFLIQAMNTQDFEQQIFKNKQKELFDVLCSTNKLNTKLWICIDLLSSFGIIVLFWAGSIDVIAGRMSVGELIAFYSYVGLFFSPVIRLVVVSASYQEATASIKRLNDIFLLRKKENNFKENMADSLMGDIEFKSVSFSYDKRKKVLNNVNFRIKRGEKIGIVGPSGSGKTTLIMLILKLLSQDSGEILIDGQDISGYDDKLFYSNISVVLQDNFLFNQTIKENICYGEYSFDEKRIVDAAANAKAHDFIVSLQKGYDTMVGERGLNFSNGQRQRIALARALFRRPNILILDEATSAVDAFTENQIQQEINNVLCDKTVIIVAHRFSTLVNADKIIVLNKDGNCIDGSHEELISEENHYSKLYYEQFK